MSVACAKKTLTSKYGITWLRCKIITATMKALRSGIEERKKVSIIVKNKQKFYSLFREEKNDIYVGERPVKLAINTIKFRQRHEVGCMWKLSLCL